MRKKTQFPNRVLCWLEKRHLNPGPDTIEIETNKYYKLPFTLQIRDPNRPKKEIYRTFSFNVDFTLDLDNIMTQEEYKEKILKFRNFISLNDVKRGI